MAHEIVEAQRSGTFFPGRNPKPSTLNSIKGYCLKRIRRLPNIGKDLGVLGLVCLNSRPQTLGPSPFAVQKQSLCGRKRIGLHARSIVPWSLVCFKKDIRFFGVA